MTPDNGAYVPFDDEDDPAGRNRGLRSRFGVLLEERELEQDLLDRMLEHWPVIPGWPG